MSADLTRWMLLLVVVLCLLGLLLFARGVEHQRGHDEGAPVALSQGFAATSWTGGPPERRTP